MRIFTGFSIVCAAALCSACISVDDRLGQDFIPAAHKWQVVSVSFDLKDIESAAAEELGGYSSRRMCVGGISGDGVSWNGNGAAFALIPLVDTAKLDFGDVQKIHGFHFAAATDTVSFRDGDQADIIQNIRVRELSKPLGIDVLYAGKGNEGLYDPDGPVVTRGIPTFSGGDSLSFDFTEAFARKYIDAIASMDSWSMEEYCKKLPGICITADRPLAGSGRINMFETAVSTNDYGYLTGNYAELKLRSVFDKERGPVDTSFVFLAGAASFIGESTSSLPTQYSFNICSRSGSAPVPSDEIVIEGGCGYKPVVRAGGLKSSLEKAIVESIARNYREQPGFEDREDAELEDLAEAVLASGNVVINKATINLPYKASPDYSELSAYPRILSPTCRLTGTRTVISGGVETEQEIVSYAGLTDASVSSENQGNINMSLDCYHPDVSHHIQELLMLSKEEDESAEDYAARLAKYDIWLLIMHEETNKAASSSSSSSSYNDYLNALAYSSYYNSLYGGYGGYGGYGYGGYGYGSYGYGSYYNNYYNYMMMAAYASQSSTTQTSTTTELDKDRYYSCRLYGPGSAEKKPTVTVTYSFPAAE